ncbi:MAG: hypothetical protein EBU08_11920 [Micrococcales bacterium]|nr:hypothetical protein [Micrococcales bacterium]
MFDRFDFAGAPRSGAVGRLSGAARAQTLNCVFVPSVRRAKGHQRTGANAVADKFPMSRPGILCRSVTVRASRLTSAACASLHGLSAEIRHMHPICFSMFSFVR